MTTEAQRPTPLSAAEPLQAVWQFRQANKGEWRPVQLPVSVHTALMQQGSIPDPYYRDNETKLQWIEEQDWEFKASFTISPQQLAQKHVELTFRGIDTYAHIYVNDSLVLETDNAFRTWRADVKRWLKPGQNELHIYFDSPTKRTEQEWKDLGYELPGGIRTLSRKPQFHFGWDWGPRLAGCGILQVPEISTWNEFTVDDVHFVTTALTPEKARVVARFRYRSEVKGTMQIFTTDERGKNLDHRVVYAGTHRDSAWFDVANPKLWWSHDLGDPYLYTFGFSVRMSGQTVCNIQQKVGIRTIELVSKPDETGQPFYFKLNGVPVFCRGANYIPQDMFQDRVTPAHHAHLLDDALAANMNMLRVWGGGLYEDDAFYQLCDEKGILVWQDFMYACAMYPGSGRFLKTAAREAMEQIERLRRHPSVVLWCGNNENNEAWHHWGWQMQFTEGQRNKLWRDYQLLFNDLLPTLVTSDGDGVPYWESSPKYGRAHKKSMVEGDAHYWGVWHDEEPFEVFNKKVPRFMSEYGLQSFPDWRTIQSFTLPEDRKLDSKVMLQHQKHPRGNALIAEYMQRDYRMPNRFEDFVYVSQLLQAEGMRVGIEAHRRNKPYCMGTLYWQLNDVWPVASWSSRDYCGRWKAMHYFVREAYKPLVALPIVEDDTLRIYGVNDTRRDTTATLHLQLLSFKGEKVPLETSNAISLPAEGSVVVWKMALKDVLAKGKSDEWVLDIRLEGGTQPYRRLFYFEVPRKLNLPKTTVSWKATATPQGVEITLQSPFLAKNVQVYTDTNGHFSDNFFDLLPNEPKTIFFKTEQPITDLEKAFKVRHVGAL